jgi:hypothetical protein
MCPLHQKIAYRLESLHQVPEDDDGCEDGGTLLDELRNYYRSAITAPSCLAGSDVLGWKVIRSAV